MFACGHGLVNFLPGRCVPSSLGRYCFLHAGFPCCLSTNACADGQGSFLQAALPIDAAASVLRGIIGIVISELWMPLEAEIASLFG